MLQSNGPAPADHSNTAFSVIRRQAQQNKGSISADQQNTESPSQQGYVTASGGIHYLYFIALTTFWDAEGQYKVKKKEKTKKRNTLLRRV